jgi:hypothetical protein
MSAAHDQLVLRAKKAEVEEALNTAAHAFDHHGLQLALGTLQPFVFHFNCCWASLGVMRFPSFARD